MKLFHTSPTEIEKISAFGRFGEFLFFSSERGQHTDGFDYAIEADEEQILDAEVMFFREGSEKLGELVAEVMELAGCDEDEAQELLSQRQSHGDAETDWDIQALTAQAARLMGYRGACVPDEHGYSYMIAMAGCENELVVCE